MTAKAAIVLLAEKCRGIRCKLWSVGDFPTVHVTCTRGSLHRLHYLVDNLIREHGGNRYADVSCPVGMLGTTELTFCFELGTAQKG